MKIDGFGSVARRGSDAAVFCRFCRLRLHRSLLLPLAMAGATLLAGTAVSLAQPVDSYLLSGGSLSGPVDFVTLFALSGTGEVTVNATLTGTGDAAAMVQTGGAMGGTARGLASYSQTGGDMTGSVTTGTYEASGGTFNGTANFSELFALSGDASLGWIDIYGDGDAVMTQTGGTMGAWIWGLETYTMSGGTILQATKVETDTFVQSGGTINGITPEDDWRAHLGFATRYELSGEAIIGLANVVGAVDATMTQSGGTMGGEVSSQTGDWTIAKYTQTGGDMTGLVYARTYDASSGNVSGTIDSYELLSLSGDAVVSNGSLLNGDGDATMTQSGGTMGGNVSGITDYDQSGGAMTGTVSGHYRKGAGSQTANSNR